MKNIVVILFVSFLFMSCESSDAVKESVKSDKEDVSSRIEYSDPARIAGSSFGEFFISMIRTQNYDMALKFTSKESIEKFGVDKIVEMYKNFDFNYTLTQKSISKENDTFTLLYATNEYATGKFKRMTVVVENDSCKLVLPDNLDEFFR